jgi:hypothetical protein
MTGEIIQRPTIAGANRCGQRRPVEAMFNKEKGQGRPAVRAIQGGHRNGNMEIWGYMGRLGTKQKGVGHKDINKSNIYTNTERGESK